jgi:hypothetical protein
MLKMRTKLKYLGKTIICNHKEITVKGDKIRKIRLRFIFFPSVVKLPKVEM